MLNSTVLCAVILFPLQGCAGLAPECGLEEHLDTQETEQVGAEAIPQCNASTAILLQLN